MSIIKTLSNIYPLNIRVYYKYILCNLTQRKVKIKTPHFCECRQNVELHWILCSSVILQHSPTTVVDISLHNMDVLTPLIWIPRIILFYKLENSSEWKWIPLHLQTLVLYKTNINQEKRKTPPSLCLSSLVLPPNS